MKSKVKVAAHNSVPFNVSNDHYTTMGFNSIVPVYFQEVINGDKINADINVFARSTPLFLPNMGNIKMHLSSVYVPFRLVFPWFDNFINGLPCSFGTENIVIECVPCITNHELTELFTLSHPLISDPNQSLQLAVPKASYADADFVVTDLDPQTMELVTTNYKLTRRGKVVLQILHSLGYNFNFIGDYENGDDSLNTSFSLLPLLSFFKGFQDWFIPSRFQNTCLIQRVLNSIQTSVPTGGVINVSTVQLASMFYECYLYYQPDYFTNAWLYNNAPADALNNFPGGFRGQSITGNGLTIDNNVNDLPLTGVTGSNARNNANYNFTSINSNQLTDIGLKILNQVSSFITRNNLAGSRAVERILARFGVQVPEVQLNYSRFLGRQKVDINVMDVVSQGSDLENLGEYSGKSFIGGSAHFESGELKERGMFFVFATLDTDSTYLDGQRRYLKHITPTSFYTPEFDGQNLQAIAGSELLGKLPIVSSVNYDVLQDHGFTAKDVFGFQPRYQEYKQNIDVISGDFDLPRYNQQIDSFILPRRFFDVSQAFRENSPIDEFSYYGFLSSNSQSDASVKPTNVIRKDDGVQYHRIFKDESSYYDPYYVHFNCKVTKVSKMIPTDDVWMLSGSGSDITMQETGNYFN